MTTSVHICMHVCGCVHGRMRVYMCMCNGFLDMLMSAFVCICALIVDVKGMVTTHMLGAQSSHSLPSLLG